MRLKILHMNYAILATLSKNLHWEMAHANAKTIIPWKDSIALKSAVMGGDLILLAMTVTHKMVMDVHQHVR